MGNVDSTVGNDFRKFNLPAFLNAPAHSVYAHESWANQKFAALPCH